GSGGLATTVKNVFKSYAAASTVFSRHRPPRNSRYASASGTRPQQPAHRSSHSNESRADRHHPQHELPPSRTTQPVKGGRNDKEDHVHNMQKSERSRRQFEGRTAETWSVSGQFDGIAGGFTA